MHFLQHIHDLKQERIRMATRVRLCNSNTSPLSGWSFPPVLKIVHWSHARLATLTFYVACSVCYYFQYWREIPPCFEFTQLHALTLVACSCLRAVQYHPTKTQQSYSFFSLHMPCDCHNRRTKLLPHVLHTGIPCMFAFNHNQVCVTEMSTVIGNTCSNVN